MKSAEEFKKQRNKKYNDWIEFDEKVKGQWKLIESIVDKSFNSLGHSQKYIDISNVGDLYKENERKLISEPNYFKITQDDNGTRLYFDEKDYNDYVNSNKKSDLKKDTNEQVRDNRKGEALKFNTIGEWLDYLDKESYKTFE